MVIIKKNFKSVFLLSFITLCLTLFWSCGGDDPDPIVKPELRYGEFIDDSTYRVFPTDADNYWCFRHILICFESSRDLYIKTARAF